MVLFLCRATDTSQGMGTTLCRGRESGFCVASPILTDTGCCQLFQFHSVLSLSCPVPDVAVLATVVDHQDLWIF